MKKKKLILYFQYLLVLLVGVFSLFGCSAVLSTGLHGGTFVSEGYKVNSQNILVAYRVEDIKGNVVEGQKCYLIKTKSGLAMYEKNAGTDGAFFQITWADDQNDHFAAWFYFPGNSGGCTGYEFVVPKDRSQTAFKYIYTKYSCIVHEIDGLKRPVSVNPIEPICKLVPD